MGEDPVKTSWWRAEQISETWQVSGPRSWTARLLYFNIRTRVTFGMWIAGDDRSKPGRELDLHEGEKLARDWVLAKRCQAAGLAGKPGWNLEALVL